MNSKEIQFLTGSDIKHLEDQFDRKVRVKSDRNEEISFNDFKEIVNNFYKFQKNSTPTAELLEKIRKKIKDSVSSEGELVVQKQDYMLLIDQIAMENEKLLNEKDPEIKNLFDLLANDSTTINKNVLGGIIKDFELPISVEELLKNFGKKDEINFSEFCSLFKSKNSGENLLRSLSSSYNSNDKESSNPNNSFPIEVRKKEHY